MFAFGVAVSDPATYGAIALPGIGLAAEPDSVILNRVGFDSIQRPYNEMLDEAAGISGLEALVLLHQDLELTDGSLIPRVRPLLRDPRIGLVGALGWAPPGAPDRPDAPGLRVSAMGGHASGRPSDRYGRSDVHYSEGSHEVDLVDGSLLVLPPWVVRSIRFDERLSKGFHGYDLDFNLRVRASKGRVVCNDIPHVHHMRRLWRDRQEYVHAMTRIAKRWDPSLRPPEWAPAFRC